MRKSCPVYDYEEDSEEPEEEEDGAEAPEVFDEEEEEEEGREGKTALGRKRKRIRKKDDADYVPESEEEDDNDDEEGEEEETEDERQGLSLLKVSRVQEDEVEESDTTSTEEEREKFEVLPRSPTSSERESEVEVEVNERDPPRDALPEPALASVSANPADEELDTDEQRWLEARHSIGDKGIKGSWREKARVTFDEAIDELKLLKLMVERPFDFEAAAGRLSSLLDNEGFRLVRQKPGATRRVHDCLSIATMAIGKKIALANARFLVPALKILTTKEHPAAFRSTVYLMNARSWRETCEGIEAELLNGSALGWSALVADIKNNRSDGRFGSSYHRKPPFSSHSLPLPPPRALSPVLPPHASVAIESDPIMGIETVDEGGDGASEGSLEEIEVRGKRRRNEPVERRPKKSRGKVSLPQGKKVIATFNESVGQVYGYEHVYFDWSGEGTVTLEASYQLPNFDQVPTLNGWTLTAYRDLPQHPPLKSFNLTAHCAPGRRNIFGYHKSGSLMHCGWMSIVHMSAPSIDLDDYAEKLTSRSRLLAEDERSAKNFHEWFEGSGGMEVPSLTTSLRCPLGRGIIDVPVRGPDCTHIECFDMVTFVRWSVQRDKYVCPVCAKVVPFVDGLVPDPIFVYVLSKAGPDAEMVTFFKGGEWEIYTSTDLLAKKRKEEKKKADHDKKKKTTTATTTTVPKRVDFIDLT